MSRKSKLLAASDCLVKAALEEAKRQAKPLTPQAKLSVMRGFAAELLEQQAPFADRIPLLRAQTELLGLTLRDQELQRLVWDARRAADGSDQLLTPGESVNLAPTSWLWEGIIMPAAVNLLVGLPKIGKTSLILAMIAAWHRGEPTFLGRPLIGPCPPVLIVGTDQPQSDWGRMLLEVGLLGPDGVIQAPLVGLAHAGRPLHLSPEGIERIGSYAVAHPGLFVLLDSIAAVTGPLGVKEQDADFAEPLRDLSEAIEPYDTTLLAIHHAGKARVTQGASLASRGTTALPAAVSQVISLAPMLSGNPASSSDRRITLKTEGRGGLPQHLLIERRETGWISHGSAESVAMAQYLMEQEGKLNDRQADALDLVRQQWAGGQAMDARALAAEMELGQNGERIAFRILNQLKRRGLLDTSLEAGSQGRSRRFWPISAPIPGAASPSSPGDSFSLSNVSGVSDPCPDQTSSAPATAEGEDTSDRKDKLRVSPRDAAWAFSPPTRVLIGSGSDAFDDEDDPAWGPRLIAS